MVGGAAPATRVTDALRTLSPDGMISSTVDKSSIIALQTPQIFSADKLFDAYDAFHGSADDDVEIFIKAGYKAAAIQGDRKNRKITYADDIPDAAKQIEEYAAAREKGRKSAELIFSMIEDPKCSPSPVRIGFEYIEGNTLSQRKD